MKKVSFFPIITLFILLINSFIVCAEEVYPPGEIYAVEKIITDSSRYATKSSKCKGILETR